MMSAALPVPALPPRVLIDYATRCNLRCPMCPVWGSSESASIDAVKGVMDRAAIDALLSELARDTLVQPSLYGEPLLIPDFKARIYELKHAHARIALNTNGLALDSAMCEFLVEARIDSVFVSIDACSRDVLARIRGIDKIESIESGVFRLLAAREHASARFPRIGVSFVVQDANRHQCDAFVERWQSAVDCVRIGLMFDASRGTYPDMDTRALERIPCPVLYETMPVHNDGSVSICCLDGFKETRVGNIREESVASVWHGEAFTRIRALHETQQWDKVPFCSRCNGWAQHIFEETTTSTHLIRKSPQFVYHNRLDRLDNWHWRDA